MFKHILVPVDGSPSGDHAAGWGLVLAAQTGASLGFLHVHSPDSRPSRGRNDGADSGGAGLEWLHTWEEAASSKGLSATVQTLEGTSVAATIQKVAEARPFDLIVMGTHSAGWLTHLLAGRTAEEVLRLTTIPLMLVRYQPHPRYTPLRRVLAPVDGSLVSLQALPWAEGIARSLDAELVVLHVCEPAAVQRGQMVLDEALARLRYAQMRGQLEAAHSAALKDTLVRAANLPGSLVVMGTHARRGLSQALLGSVAEQVARSALVPVLLLPPAVLGKDLEASSKPSILSP